jgi:hypothetical protein
MLSFHPLFVLVAIECFLASVTLNSVNELTATLKAAQDAIMLPVGADLALCPAQLKKCSSCSGQPA